MILRLACGDEESSPSGHNRGCAARGGSVVSEGVVAAAVFATVGMAKALPRSKRWTRLQSWERMLTEEEDLNSR